jgi:hypothetical protein
MPFVRETDQEHLKAFVHELVEQPEIRVEQIEVLNDGVITVTLREMAPQSPTGLGAARHEMGAGLSLSVE